MLRVQPGGHLARDIQRSARPRLHGGDRLEHRRLVAIHPELRQLWGHERIELLGGRHREILAVHPLELRHVEDRGFLLDPGERKQLDHLVQRHDLAVAAGTPSEQRQEVPHGGGENAHVLIVAHRRRAVALGELLAVGAVDHRDMAEHRQRSAKRAIQRDLFWRVRDVVVAAQHVGDSHVEIVHDHGEVVDRGAIGAQDDEVLDIGALERDAAVHRVLPGDLTGRHAEPDRALLHVRLALGEEAVGDFLVALHAGALEHQLFVPVETQPGEPIEDHLRMLVGRASLIGVLDAQQELAALVAGVQPVEEGGAGASDVEVARRGRSEADAGVHRG